MKNYHQDRVGCCSGVDGLRYSWPRLRIVKIICVVRADAENIWLRPSATQPSYVGVEGAPQNTLLICIPQGEGQEVFREGILVFFGRKKNGWKKFLKAGRKLIPTFHRSNFFHFCFQNSCRVLNQLKSKVFFPGTK